MAFPLGTLVVNFGITAKVVDHFKAADGQPSPQDGWPILREMSADRRRFIGGKWLANPALCAPATEAGR